MFLSYIKYVHHETFESPKKGEILLDRAIVLIQLQKLRKLGVKLLYIIF